MAHSCLYDHPEQRGKAPTEHPISRAAVIPTAKGRRNSEWPERESPRREPKRGTRSTSPTPSCSVTPNQPGATTGYPTELPYELTSIKGSAASHYCKSTQNSEKRGHVPGEKAPGVHGKQRGDHVRAEHRVQQGSVLEERPDSEHQGHSPPSQVSAAELPSRHLKGPVLRLPTH